MAAHEELFGQGPMGAAQWPPRYTPATGFEGMPGVGGMGMAGLPLQMLLEPLLRNIMGQAGMMPMGISDRSIHDRWADQQFTREHTRLLREAAQTDFPAWMDVWRGAANVTGAKWGEEQMRSASAVTQQIVNKASFAAEFAPELVGEMLGDRGSAMMMAHYMHLGGRYRIDPNTGQAGVSPREITELTQGLYKDFYGEGAERPAIDAGRLGLLHYALQQRGMMPGRGMLEEVIRGRPERMRELARDAGVEGPLADLTAEDRDRLLAHPEVQGEMQAFDKGRVSTTLRDWADSVEAMREIFGDAGHPNAPLPALINALNQLTSGGMSQLDPSQVAAMVQDTVGLARASGIGLQGAIIGQAQAEEMAQMAKIDPLFASFINQQMMGFRAGYQDLGRGAYQAYGRGDLDQLATMRGQAAAQAIASPLANQRGLALRLDQMAAIDPDTGKRLGVLEPGSPVADYLNKALAGAGRDIGDEEFAGMIAKSTNGRVTQAQAMLMLEQSEMNRYALTQAPEITTDVLGIQYRDMLGIQRRSARGHLATWVREHGGEDLTEVQAGDLTEMAGKASIAAMADMAANNLEAWTDETPGGQRAAIIGAAIHQQIEKASLAGDEGATSFMEEFGGDRQEMLKFFTTMGGSLYGALHQENVDLGRGSLQNLFEVHSPAVRKQAERHFMQQRIETMQRKALRPLGKGGMLRRAMQAVMEADPDDEQALMKVFAQAFGGERGEEVGEAIQGQFVEMRELYQAYRKAGEDWAGAADPEEKAAAREMLDARADALEQGVRKASTDLKQRGYDFNARVDTKDLGRFVRHAKYVEQIRKQEQGGQIVEDALSDEQAWWLARTAKATGIDEEVLMFGESRALRKLNKEQRRDLARIRTGYSEKMGAEVALGEQNVRDMVAQIMSDPLTVERLGEEAIDRTEKLRADDRRLHVLAQEQGISVEALIRKGGKEVDEILDRRGQHMDWFLHKVGGRGEAYKYMGTATRDKLTGIAKKLHVAEELPQATIEGVLALGGSPDRLKQLVDAGVIDKTDADVIQEGWDAREVVRERYIESREAYAKEGKLLFQDFLATATNLDREEVEKLMQSKKGDKWLKAAMGAGDRGEATRAHFAQARKDIEAYHEGTLTKAQEARVKAKYGGLLDVYQSEDVKARRSKKAEDIWGEMDRMAPAIEDAAKAEGQEQVIKIDVAKLEVYEDDSASFVGTSTGASREFGGAA